MRIIDYERKGNVIRFYLGEYTKDWGWTNKDYRPAEWKYGDPVPAWLEPSDIYYGDDWDDIPYEHNAGTVYKQFIKGTLDIKCDFDDLVLEPCDGTHNSEWSKKDMRNRLVPCIIVIPKSIYKEKTYIDDFTFWVGADGAVKFYFGDEIGDSDQQKIERIYYPDYDDEEIVRIINNKKE